MHRHHHNISWMFSYISPLLCWHEARQLTLGERRVLLTKLEIRATARQLTLGERRVLLTKLEIRANELRQKEDELHKGMAPPLRKVAGTKNLFLWKKLIEQPNFDDKGIYSFMSVSSGL